MRTAKVEFGGVVKEASLALLPEAKEGNYVVVHAGIALQIMDEEAARQVFQALVDLERAMAAEKEPA